MLTNTYKQYIETLTYHTDHNTTLVQVVCALKKTLINTCQTRSSASKVSVGIHRKREKSSLPSSTQRLASVVLEFAIRFQTSFSWWTKVASTISKQCQRRLSYESLAFLVWFLVLKFHHQNGVRSLSVLDFTVNGAWSNLAIRSKCITRWSNHANSCTAFSFLGKKLK